VRRPCLEYALITRQGYGIWGGCDENDRRLLNQQVQGTRADAEEQHSASAASG
jgi:hypothetical protein